MDMDKKEFWNLVKEIPQDIERKKKQMEEEAKMLYGESEDGEIVSIHLWDKDYIFDRVGYQIVEKLWDKGVLTKNEDGYLCVQENSEFYPVTIHSRLKKEECEKLAKELNCPSSDVHVHHKYGLYDNRLDSLEVLHKDEHAKRHGFETWEQLLEARKKGRPRS